jgi:hypothetical protein
VLLKIQVFWDVSVYHEISSSRRFEKKNIVPSFFSVKQFYKKLTLKLTYYILGSTQQEIVRRQNTCIFKISPTFSCKTVFIPALSTLSIVCALNYSGRAYDLQFFCQARSCEYYASRRFKRAGDTVLLASDS